MSKKKVLLIVLPIVLVIIIIAAIIIGILLNKSKENESVGSTWGDTYYAYLKEAVKETDLKQAEEKYGMMLDMKDAKIQFCEVEENQDPSMIMTYKKNESKYVNVYKINEDRKVTYIAYKQPSELEYLYNIENNQFLWYVHTDETSNNSYSSLKNVVNNMKNNSKQSENSDNVNVAELEADYTIKKEEEVISQETADGNTLTMNKFDEIFVKPEIEQNKQIDFNIDEKLTDLKKSIASAVGDYKKESERLTDEAKEAVTKKAEENKKQKEEITKAKEAVDKKKEDEKKLAEEYAKGLKIGSATLKYGIYTYSDDGVFTPGSKLEGTITLKPNGKFHVKSNFDEMSARPASHDEDGTYTVKLNQDDGYGGRENYISFKGEKGYSMTFQVYQDNSFSDQWHFYKLKTETKPEISSNSSSSSSSTTTTNQSTSSNNSSSNGHLTAFEYDTSTNNKIAEGTYYRAKGTGYESVLEIKNSTNNSFEFSINAIYTSVAGSPNIGQIEGTAKAVKGGNYVFATKQEGTYGYEYNIFFKFSGDGSSPTITIDDECYMNKYGLTEVNPVSGHNVTFEGEYNK